MLSQEAECPAVNITSRERPLAWFPGRFGMRATIQSFGDARWLRWGGMAYMGGTEGEERRPSHGMVFALVGLALLAGVIGGGIAGGLVAALVPRDNTTPARAGNPTAVATG